MAFPDEQNNLNDNPTPLTGTHSISWAVRVIDWIRDSLVPAIKGMVVPIEAARSNSATALTTAQARLQTNLSNIQQARTTVENLVGGSWAGNRAGWILAVNDSQNGIILKEEDTGVSLSTDLFYTGYIRTTESAGSAGSSTSASQSSNESFGFLLGLLNSIMPGHVIVGADRTQYNRNYSVEVNVGPGQTRTETRYTRSYQYRFIYRRVNTS